MRRWVGTGLAVAIAALVIVAGLMVFRPSALPGEGAHVDGPLLVSAAPAISRGGMAAIVQGEIGYDDAVTGSGGYVNVSSLVSGERHYGLYGDEGESLLTDCVDPTGQVAFFNEGSEGQLVD